MTPPMQVSVHERQRSQQNRLKIPSFALFAALCLSLAACATTSGPVATPPPKPRIAAPSPTTMAECERPLVLKSGALTQKQAEIAWGVDVDHLVECGARHRILANYIRKRDAALGGQP